jgi:hypothetical protein
MANGTHLDLQSQLEMAAVPAYGPLGLGVSETQPADQVANFNVDANQEALGYTNEFDFLPPSIDAADQFFQFGDDNLYMYTDQPSPDMQLD